MLEKFILQQRVKRNMTQSHLASGLGISRPTYMQIEHGKREITVTEARKLSEIFNITLNDFLAGHEPKYEVILPGQVSEGQNSFNIRINEKNLEKFKQVILYVLGKVGSRPNVGETVLHKLFYFIDFDYYEKFEENLMGATYIKNYHGPTSVELGSIIENMSKNGDIEAVQSKYFKYEQKKYLPRKRPNLDILSAREIEHIEDVLARLADKNAKEIENYSHEDIPWKSAHDGEPLSYESVFYRDERYSVRNYADEI